MTATLDELRDLSRRSRRAQRWAILATLTALILYPTQLLIATRYDATIVTAGALALGALPFLRYAYLAGQERGAFRRVFRRIADDRLTRRITPTDARNEAQVSPITPAQKL